jgi:F-type H+-transporting ATPase subunit epsilon
MARMVKLKLVTPERVLCEKECEMVIMRSVEGDLGVLAGHENLTVTLAPGKLRVINGDEEEIIAVLGGFAVVEGDGVTILSDQAELPEEIDRERALAAKERAERRLKNPGDIDVKRAENALRRSLVRLEVCTQSLARGKS